MKVLQKIKFKHVDELITPKHDLTVIKDCYWLVKDNHVMGYDAYCKFKNTDGAPQCNRDENIATLIRDRMYKDCDVVFIPLAYWKYNDE